ncbi:hypothetical protein BD779DRAFT_1795370 [Infundibulicybe gibba]|nr:hypothetical protein BD779DRAFT_1795370 [Infundibulicybe gibba]
MSNAASTKVVPPTPTEQDLSESELRELYDSEEIERFMALFSAYVTEVRLPETPEEGNPFQWGLGEDHVTEGQLGEEGWVSAEQSPIPQTPLSNSNLSEAIASRYVIPNLPPAAFPPPIFTLGRLRLTIQRLYLVTQPVYIPFALRLLKLAVWEDYRRSAFYCVLYWVLWYYNTLLPSLILRILYSLIRWKFSPYPSLSDLQEHRSEVMRAHEFGNEIADRLSASSTFGIKEVWRLFRVLKQTKKEKAGAFIKRTKVIPPEDSEAMSPEPPNDTKEDATVLDESDDGQDARDLKRLVLHILSELADLHERIKNIFIWRRPTSSRNYALMLFILFLLTWLLPAKYLSKAIYFVAGFFFWHLSPILAAMPASERARLPPIFHDVPTDADYAMELISKRVAAGLDVRPPRNRRKRHTRAKSEPGNPPEQSRALSPAIPPVSDSFINWKKWGERAALGKAWADDGSRLLSSNQSTSNLDLDRNLPALQRGSMVGVHTFPAQHSTAPGLVTITPTALLFTSIMSSDAKITIPLGEIRGVRKVGLLKGLSIRWRSPEGLEVEEKFRWIGGRDELFARLVGHQSDGRPRWLKV